MVEVPNVELVFREVTNVVAGDGAGQAFTDCKTVSLPFITNPAAIEKGQDIVLKHAVVKKEAKGKRGRTWVDEVSEAEKKRLKEQGKRDGA